MNFGRFSPCNVMLTPPTPVAWYSPWRVFRRRRVILCNPLVYSDPRGKLEKVPAGFKSDGASVPAILSPFLPSQIDTMEAAILHDWLCGLESVPNSYADAVFRTALRANDISGFYAWIMYAGLRIASPFRNNSDWNWLNAAKWIGGAIWRKWMDG